MGWSGGTDLFDGAVDVAISGLVNRGVAVQDEDVQYIVKMMYEVFEYTDWDTEEESCYYEPFLKKVLQSLGRHDD